MAHFAEIEASGTVLRVIVLDNQDAPGQSPEHSEPLGQSFIAETLGLPGEWRQTSYNGNFRKQYAGLGYRYDADADVFIAPQPYPSWTLDADYDWQPPTPRPTEGRWYWDEPSLSWIALPDPSLTQE